MSKKNSNNEKRRQECANTLQERVSDIFPNIIIKGNYINAREDFLDFLNSIEEVEENSNNTKVIKEIDANIKYKERLRISYYELEKFLKYKGFESVRQGNTTHAIWKHKETGLSIPVPNKSRTMPQGTVSKILRMINSNRHELAQFLK